MLVLCLMLWHTYYAKNYGGIIDAGLFLRELVDEAEHSRPEATV